jgi:hypothetical protein
MRKALVVTTVFGVCLTMLSAQSQAFSKKPLVIQELKHDVSAPLHDIAIPARSSTGTPTGTQVPRKGFAHEQTRGLLS